MCDLSVKCCSSCYLRCVWHITQLMHGNQHSQHPKKPKKQPETRKQVSQWMAEDSKLREIKLISKKF